MTIPQQPPPIRAFTPSRHLRTGALYCLVAAVFLVTACGQLSPAPNAPTAEGTAGHSPTLINTPSEQEILTLLQTNAGCELPCWWGITPGITPWSQARTQLEGYGAEISLDIQLEGGISKFGVYGFNFKEYGQYLYSFYIRDDQILGITIQASDYTDPRSLIKEMNFFHPENITSRLNGLTRVDLDVVARNTETSLYAVLLYFDASGTFLSYQGVSELNKDDEYPLCPTFGESGNLSASFFVALYDVDLFNSADDFFEVSSSIFSSSQARLISEFSSLTTTEFLTRLRAEQGLFCFAAKSP